MRLSSSIKFQQHFMCFLECILVMSFYKRSCSVYDYSQTLHLNGWTFTSHTFEITIILCASENALWLCASWNDFVQYIYFHKPCIWMVESSCELFLNDILKEKVASSSFMKLTLLLLTHESAPLPSFYVLLKMHFGYVFLQDILFRTWFFTNLAFESSSAWYLKS